MAFQSREILGWFEMVLKHRDKKISLQEDGQNITAKDLRETEFFNISQCNGPFAAERSRSKSPN